MSNYWFQGNDRWRQNQRVSKLRESSAEFKKGWKKNSNANMPDQKRSFSFKPSVKQKYTNNS